jgi:Suppressor of fused protein (SUFU)
VADEPARAVESLGQGLILPDQAGWRNAVYERERKHLKGFWPDREHEEFTWTLGPIAARMPHFRVCRVAPTSGNDPWIYATIGAWEADPVAASVLEFVLLSPNESALHVEHLAMVTNFHTDERYRLAVGQTINIGRPWVEGSSCASLLVSLPYPLGSAFEFCDGGEPEIRYLWLVPVTAAEADFLNRNGLEALERRFEEARINAVDANRKSVV